MRPTLVKVQPLSTAEALVGTLTAQGSENKPKFAIKGKFNIGYKIH
jgi:hypothetical protein